MDIKKLNIDEHIRDIVRAEVDARLADLTATPELIDTDEACKLLGGESGPIDKSVFLNLHHRRDTNGFPSVYLGPRTIKTDKRRLAQWCAEGGLREVNV